MFSIRKLLRSLKAKLLEWEEYSNDKSAGFYDFDVWKDIRDKIGDMLPQGITVYGEAVGYLPNGKWIQKGYHYGCKPGTYEIYIYRVTYTNPEGKVTEFNWPMMKEFCRDYGFKMVHEWYYGAAGLYLMEAEYWEDQRKAFEADPDKWREDFIDFLKKDTHYGMADQMCKFCNREVPSEGVVVRIDHLKESEAFKLKNFKFLERETKELDSGEVNIEDAQ